MTIEVAEKPHAVLGASGWHTWSACPGSVVLSEGIPNNSSRYAKEGTAAHALLEHCLQDGAFLNAEESIGEEIVVEGEVFVVDQDMADAVNSTIDIIRSYMDEGAILLVEQMVPLQHMTGEEGALGTLDVAVISGSHTLATFVDFKYGQGVMVYASDKGEAINIATGEKRAAFTPNGQLSMYASGWLQANGFMYEEIQQIRLAIVQPRMEWHDEFTITIDELRAFEDRAREAAGNVELNRQVAQEGNDLDLNPGEKQCKFCKAKGICPALKNATSKALSAIVEPSKASDFENLSLPKQAAAVVVNEGVSNERLAEFMRAAPLIEEAVKGVREEVQRRLMAGQEIPGFYIGVGRAGARKWSNEEAARKELTKSGRMKVADATVAKVKSPTQIEKLAGKARWWAKVAPLIDQPPGGPTLCKEGDSNPRFKIVSEVSEFANLDAPDAALPASQMTIDAEATPVVGLEDIMG